MLIYRVEDKSDPKTGAWGCRAAAAAIDQAYAEDAFVPSTHPSPAGDPGICRCPDPSEHCGFPSLDCYRTWFTTPGVRRALYANGIAHMRVYDVPDHLVAVGMLQVLFRLSDATSVRVATPEEIA